MTPTQRRLKAEQRIEGLEVMHRLQEELGNTGRADIMLATINKLKEALND
tara:strand:- start:177 stop:326 length:150 start_codon:yes stop_codon:yes gene_type:complete